MSAVVCYSTCGAVAPCLWCIGSRQDAERDGWVAGLQGGWTVVPLDPMEEWHCPHGAMSVRSQEDGELGEKKTGQKDELREAYCLRIGVLCANGTWVGWP